MYTPLTVSLEDCRICSLPLGVAQCWLQCVRIPDKGCYSAIDQNFDLPGVGEVPLHIYRDFCGNFYLIHEPV